MMAQCSVNGVQVLFPYTPYPVQEEYMKKVIECLQKGVNGILESPTGTGKTLSLLCSSLAWLESYKAQHQLSVINKEGSQKNPILGDLKSLLNGLVGTWDEGNSFSIPRIIYSSRTHSQLSQAIQELKRSSYRHVRSVVLGSRDQLCVHPEVSKAPNHTAKMYMCRAKISSKTCPFYLNYEEKLVSIPQYQDTPVLDIEDLVTLGKKHTVCPYFAARNLKSKSDMIFTPYNYIIDPKSRRAHGIEMQGNIVIFDEAHNIEGACEESMSFQLRSYDLALCITEVTQTIEMVKNYDKEFSSSDSGAPDFTLTDLSILKVLFCELEEMLDNTVTEKSGKDTAMPGDYMIDLLKKVDLTAEKKEVVLELLDKVILYLSTKTTSSSAFAAKGAGMQKFSDLVNILFSRVNALENCRTKNFQEELSKKFKVFLQQETQNKGQQGSNDPWSSGKSKKKSWRLDCWCFSPSLGMQDIVNQGVHSVILTSGTLSPLGPMINELGVNFPVQLENPHIIKDNQVFVGVVACGPDGTPLNSSFQNRSNEKYISSLGRTITNFSRMVPDGLLVFFPSYSVMRSNTTHWEESGVWQSLVARGKPVFVEPTGKDAFQESIEKYYAVIKQPESKGAILLAVCRGKVSEGLDFADENARAVVITGLPFPPSMDPRVKLKMEYLNAIAKENNGLYGNDWYVLQASRAVNQAIGRVIRHKDDFGAILLCDNRFRDKRIQTQLSKWIQGRINVFESFGPALKQLSSFFKGLDQLPRRAPQNSSLSRFQPDSSTYRTKDGSTSSAMASSSKNSEELEQKKADLFEGYKQAEKSDTSSASCSKSSSIFDVMDNSESTDHYAKSPLSNFGSSVYVSKEQNGNMSVRPKDPKRRKISVALRQANEPESSESDSSAELWKNFLLEIRALLGISEKYAIFCTAIKSFKVSKDVEKFAESMKSVFAQVPNKSKMIQTASLLVRTDERERFIRLSS